MSRLSEQRAREREEAQRSMTASARDKNKLELDRMLKLEEATRTQITQQARCVCV